MVEQRGTDVKSLVAFVKENEEVLDQMKASCYNLLCENNCVVSAVHE